MERNINRDMIDRLRDITEAMESGEISGLRVTLITQPTPTFEAWCRALDDHARSVWGVDWSITESTGVDCWRSYYDSGGTPEDAFAEDCSYGDPE